MGAVKPRDVPRLREQFAGWPRDTRDVGRQREHADPERDIGSPALGREGAEREQPALSACERAGDRQPPRTAPARPEPGSDTRDVRLIPVMFPGRQPGGAKGRAASRSGRQREAGRDEPEIGR